ncbi:uncharacterized protein LDX57_008775 [Aspergillus melleus]|uniref:uncharacterized protein n=1 Tax=Aspergillus melleus TaxID=138277 RepID=UPI001E8E505E|nr:uncharacterized protein LDX57_008775 [Aspergillus melleus]KAH8431114.1 hypothetical protein LDX57_008775 [Aspergillus melleus]
MSDPNKPSSPGLYEDFFRRQSWPEPWDESEFSPDQRRAEIQNRVRSKVSKGITESFFEHSFYPFSCWPWGFFIYRTAYGSDEDWNQALAKLHRYIHYDIWRTVKDEPEAAKIVWEGCHNVIVEDRKLLEGASPIKVRELFQEWIVRNPEHDNHSEPRSSFCLMIDDHAIQSILASSEPGLDRNQPGYVILIGRSFPDKGGLRFEPFNGSWMRLLMHGIWRVTCNADDFDFDDLCRWIAKPCLIPYCDGSESWVEDVNGQKVTGPYSSGDEEDEDDDDDEEEDGYTEAGGYPLYDNYKFLKKGGHI